MTFQIYSFTKSELSKVANYLLIEILSYFLLFASLNKNNSFTVCYASNNFTLLASRFTICFVVHYLTQTSELEMLPYRKSRVVLHASGSHQERKRQGGSVPLHFQGHHSLQAAHRGRID